MKTVIETLQTAILRYRRIFYLPNSGNAGDALINMGFYSVAKKIGLAFEEITSNFNCENLDREDLVILPGGGYIVPYWGAGSKTLQRLTTYRFPLLLLPQSVDGREEILSLLRPMDTLFLRERYSYDYAQSLDLKCALSMDHDLAFSVEAADILSFGTIFPRPSIRNFRKIARIGYHYGRSRFIGRLAAWRTDGESLLREKKPKINDISLLTKFGTTNQEMNRCTAQWLLKTLSWYDVVETDRLHVCIACALVGTRVILHLNAYHKIKGVFEYSIQPDPRYAHLVALAANERT